MQKAAASAPVVPSLSEARVAENAIAGKWLSKEITCWLSPIRFICVVRHTDIREVKPRFLGGMFLGSATARSPIQEYPNPTSAKAEVGSRFFSSGLTGRKE